MGRPSSPILPESVYITSAYLRAVLGPPAVALERLAGASPTVEAFLLPRTVTAWLESAAYRPGPLPGVPEVAADLHKSETGWTGAVHCPAGTVEIRNAPAARAAAAVLVGLGVQSVPVPGPDVDLARLGRTIDLLVKTHHVIKPPVPGRVVVLTKAEVAVPCPTCGATQMLRNVVTLCACLTGLAKHLQVVPQPDGYRLEVGPEWTSCDLEILEEAVGRG